MRRTFPCSWLCACALFVLAAPAQAETPAPPVQPSTAPQTELDAAWASAQKTAKPGPAKIRLLDQAVIAIPADQFFIPAAEANRIMVALGNPATPARFGLILSRKAQENWIVDVDWIKEGYVRDDDAKDWKPDALLASLKENTERDNAGRQQKGIPAIDVIGWAQPPAYDAGHHRLVWSMQIKNRGAPAGEPQTINYNTYALGRDGYVSLDLITDSTHIAMDRNVANQLLGSLHFAPGKRYQDFNGSTDKIAAYGLAGLIGIVAVKKLGLLAVAALFLLKIWKLGLVAVVGGIAAARKYIGRKSGEDGTA